MRFAFAAIALAALAVADPVPQGVSSAIAPSKSPPPGCSPNYNGAFQIAIRNVTLTRKRGLQSRQDHDELGITLQNGVLTDDEGRTGYIAANNQFQFDDPPQAGAIFTSGFTVCQNGSLSLGGTSIWYRCLSGAGPTSDHDFYNLYNTDIGSVCIQSFFIAVPSESGDGPAPVPASLSTATYASSSVVANSSSSAGASSSSSSGPASSSASASASSSSSAGATGTGGGATGGGATTGRAGATATQGGQTGGGGGAATSSSSQAGAAAYTAMPAGLAKELSWGGLAAGLLAFAVM